MRKFSILTVPLWLSWLPALTCAQGLDGPAVLEGLAVPEKDVALLEQGEVLAYSDEEYENTPRELSADAIVLADTDLETVKKALVDAVTVIPHKLLKDHATIESEADFANVKYEEADIREVEKLFSAGPGKGFNFSDDEYRLLEARLNPVANASTGEKVAAASDLMREILVGRYSRYRAEGLAGIPGYARGRGKVVDVGQELLLTTQTFKPFESDFPAFYRNMEAYPMGAECCEQHFRWLKVRLRKRPTFALSHTMIQKTDDFVLYTERFYFVNNSLNSVQITLSWLPYDEDTYMGLAVSASADVLDSMMGKMLRPLGRNKAVDLVTEALTDIRGDLEEGDPQEGEN